MDIEHRRESVQISADLSQRISQSLQEEYFTSISLSPTRIPKVKDSSLNTRVVSMADSTYLER